MYANSNRRRELVSVPPKKAAFISRLAPCTVIDEMKVHIATKIFNINPRKISIFKLKPTEERIASLKVKLPTEHFNAVLDKSFWPKGTLVREFTLSADRINTPRNVSPAKD